MDDDVRVDQQMSASSRGKPISRKTLPLDFISLSVMALLSLCSSPLNVGGGGLDAVFWRQGYCAYD
ncbi:MAG: hypothetical protein P0119_07475 [Nitrospira sp.]|nr:hypothetical protein [Nitrospira sp.]